MQSVLLPSSHERHGFIEVAKIRGALLEHCKLDTLGMVRILEKLISASTAEVIICPAP